MNFGKRIGLIIKETFSSPTKNSYVTTVGSNKVVLRENGKYKRIDLKGANLTNAHLENIDLEGADLSDTTLSGAVLRGANLKGAKLEGAVVSGTDFTNAIIGTEELKGVSAVIEPKGINNFKIRG